MYRRQIEGFRRLRRVMAELVAIGEELSDRGLSVGDEAVKKTPKSRSSRAGR
jgi:hypothetical protein